MYYIMKPTNSKYGEIEDSNRFWLSMVKLEESKAAPEKVFYRYIAKK